MTNKSSFHENPDNRYDTEMRLKALENSDESLRGKMDDDQRLGVPSHDESMASDYIRNRVEPPADMVSGREYLKIETPEQSEGDYEKDIKRLKALSEDQLDALLTEIENKSKEGRGLFSKGGLLNGYAIDRESLESLQSVHHQGIAFELAANIAEKRRDEGDMDADIDRIKRKVVSGIVYLEVPNFNTPIVKLWLGIEEMGDAVPKNDVEKIANHLKSERKLLPMSADLKVL